MIKEEAYSELPRGALPVKHDVAAAKQPNHDCGTTCLLSHPLARFQQEERELRPEIPVPAARRSFKIGSCRPPPKSKEET
jgi:hypothetical protein